MSTRTLNANGAVTAEINQIYDTLGRLTSYTDADGNTSTTEYDIASRRRIINDGKATQPFWLHWPTGSGWRRHAPDFFARLDGGGGVVVDVRADDRIRDRDAQAFRGLPLLPAEESSNAAPHTITRHTAAQEDLR